MQGKRLIGIGLVGVGLALAFFLPASARHDDLAKTEAPARMTMAEYRAKNEGLTRYYEVQKGDSLWGIARAEGVDLDTLARVNAITNLNHVRIGQRLLIPSGDAGSSREAEVRHRVGSGETLWSIARKYQVRVSDIVTANGLSDPDLIVQGREIVVPEARPVTLAARSEWGSLLWPVNGAVTSFFGPRNGRMHKGIDIAGNTGEPIRAARSGKVSFSGSAGTFGLLVILDHGGGMTTYYAHCSTLLVKTGEQVYAGQTIARVGSTGRSEGPHLHFEVRMQDEPQDPAAMLPGAPQRV